MTKTLEELKVYRHQWYLENKEHHNALCKAASEKNKEKYLEYHKNHYWNNKEYYQQKGKEWHKEHKEKRCEYTRNYRIAHGDACKQREKELRKIRDSEYPELAIAYSQKRRALEYGAPGRGITAQQAIDLKKETMGHCVYCCKEKKLTIDHVVPLTSGGRHDIDNAVPACQSCNSSKGTKSLLVYLYYRNTVD